MEPRGNAFNHADHRITDPYEYTKWLSVAISGPLKLHGGLTVCAPTIFGKHLCDMRHQPVGTGESRSVFRKPYGFANMQCPLLGGDGKHRKFFTGQFCVLSHNEFGSAICLTEFPAGLVKKEAFGIHDDDIAAREERDGLLQKVAVERRVATCFALNDMTVLLPA